MNGPAAFGTYLLDRRVGAGGMAEVFAARRVHAAGVEQRVVIKRILPRLAGRPEQVALFLDEARVSAALCHPNIAQVHDFGEIDGAWFLALEQVDGPDLRSLLRALAEEGEQLPVQLALYVVHEVLAALEHAHEAHLDGQPLGIVHRDVCPANVMVSRQGRIKLVDFGVACSALGGARRDAVHGHIAYMSPEQVSGRPVDPRSDLFSVGVLLHELLTGRRLFRGVDAADSARRVRERPIAAPSALSAQAPPELDALVLRALARDPADRLPDASSFRRALRAHMDLRVVDDCPDTLARVVHRLEGALAGAGTATLAPVEGAALAHTVQVRPRTTRSDTDTASLSLPRRRRTTLGVALGAVLALALAVGVAWQAARPPTPVALVALARSPAPAPLPVGAPDLAPAASPQPSPAVARTAPPSPPRAPPPDTAPRAAPPPVDAVSAAEPPLAAPSVQVPQATPLAVALPAAPVSEAAPTTAAPPPATPPPATAGTVSVSFSPGWARVSVDGRRLKGSTPFDAVELSPGSHTLRIEHPPTGRVYLRTVEVLPGQHQHLRVQAQ